MKNLSAKKSILVPYAAFLRGINVGGHAIIKMEDLKKAFESLGLKNVRTLLASGNVLFEAPKTSVNVLTKKIEEKLAQKFKRPIGTLIRTIEELERLKKSGPFKGVKVTPQTRLYVTFLSEKPSSKLKIPYSSPDGNFRILRASETELSSVATLTPNNRTVELMAIVEKEYGKKVTTRNWNTIAKVLKTSI